jgi:hypothetical protein
LRFGGDLSQPWQDRLPDPMADELIASGIALESFFIAMQSVAVA